MTFSTEIALKHAIANLTSNPTIKADVLRANSLATAWFENSSSIVHDLAGKHKLGDISADSMENAVDIIGNKLVSLESGIYISLKHKTSITLLTRELERLLVTSLKGRRRVING
jgi:hypothetical protein